MQAGTGKADGIKCRMAAEEMTNLSCCYEEPDKRFFLPAQDAALSNYATDVSHSPDTDVTILVLDAVSRINAQIFHADTQQKTLFIDIHAMAKKLGQIKGSALHFQTCTFTSCDSTSACCRRKKESALQVLLSNPSRSSTMAALVSILMSMISCLANVNNPYVTCIAPHQ